MVRGRDTGNHMLKARTCDGIYFPGGNRRGVNQSKIQNKRRNAKQKRNGLKMVADSTYGLYGQGQMVTRAEERRDSIYFNFDFQFSGCDL